MFIKRLFIPIIMGFSSLSFAGQFYIGPSLVLQQNSAHHQSDDYVGIGPKITLGYGTKLSDRYFLAYELFGQFGAINLSHSDSDNLKSSQMVGASILPGFALSNTTKLYGRGSVVSARFSEGHSHTEGIQGGLGLQQQLSDKWDIRGEYTYTRYSSVDDIESPRSNAISVGFVRKFN